MSVPLPAALVALPGAVWAAALAGAPSPAPTPDPDLTVYTVTPGIGGFLAFFVLALASWLLFRSMTKHVRTVDHNARAARVDDRPAVPRADEAGDGDGTGAPPSGR